MFAPIVLAIILVSFAVALVFLERGRLLRGSTRALWPSVWVAACARGNARTARWS